MPLIYLSEIIYLRFFRKFRLRLQDPGSFDEQTQKVMRDAMVLRYSLLPYLYTLFYHAHVDGNTVVRAIFHEYVSLITADEREGYATLMVCACLFVCVYYKWVI